MFRFTVREQHDDDPSNSVSFASENPFDALLSALDAIGFVPVEAFLAKLVVSSTVEEAVDDYEEELYPETEPFPGHKAALADFLDAAKRLAAGFSPPEEEAADEGPEGFQLN